MQLSIAPTVIPGCLVLQPRVVTDVRGRFTKVFHAPAFAAHGLVTHFAEEYYSVSRRGVLRGMHFQRPPADHVKVVYCTAGRVLDVVVDLRGESPTYGQHAMVELSAERGNMLYVPRGLAHGFLVVAEEATLVYKVETVHAPAEDAGVAWDGCGIDWPVKDPILSDRDRGFPTFDTFETPFATRSE